MIDDLYKVIGSVKYRGCIIRVVDYLYTWGRTTGTEEEAKAAIDKAYDSFRNSLFNINHPKNIV